MHKGMKISFINIVKIFRNNSKKVLQIGYKTVTISLARLKCLKEKRKTRRIVLWEDMKSTQMTTR